MDFWSRSSTSRVSTLPEGIVEKHESTTNVGDEYAQILTQYGPPERDDSTENDAPRPAIVTRFVEYRPENVKIAFLPIAKIGDLPQYRGWKVIGYIDINTNTKMSGNEAEGRLKRRIRE